MGAYESKDLFEAIEAGDIKRTKRVLDSCRTRHQYVLNQDGLPPICVAAKLGFEEIIVLLLEYGFTPHVPDDRCWFPVHYAAMNDQRDVIYVLVNRGQADVTKRCPVDSCKCEKSSALHAAAYYGSYDAAKTLLQCGVDVTAKNYEGKTAEQVAMERGFSNVADLLLRSAKLLE